MKRVFTAVPLLAIAIYLVCWAPHAVFMVAAAAMGLLCYREYSELVFAHGIPKPGILGIAAGLAILFWPQYMLLVASGLVVVLASVALRTTDLSGILPQVACVFLGVIYTFVPWRVAADLRSVSVHLLFFALALNWAGDSLAYYVGRRFGKRKLAPVVSPKKSWEGSIASVLGSVVFGLLYLGIFVPILPIFTIIVLALVGNIAGQFGDLFESAVKRGAGVKDSGTLLPGHGGMLDRVDSSLFALPAVYFCHFLLALHFVPVA